MSRLASVLLACRVLKVHVFQVLHAAARPMIHTFEEVDETNNRLTAASYGGRKQAGKWKVEDTRRFYRVRQLLWLWIELVVVTG